MSLKITEPVDLDIAEVLAKAAAGAGHHSGRRVGRMLRAVTPSNVAAKLGHWGKECWSSGPLRVRGSEDGANIPQAGRGEQGVTNGVAGDVTVGMASQTDLLVGEVKASNVHRHAFTQLMDIGPNTGPDLHHSLPP